MMSICTQSPEITAFISENKKQTKVCEGMMRWLYKMVLRKGKMIVPRLTDWLPCGRIQLSQNQGGTI